MNHQPPRGKRSFLSTLLIPLCLVALAGMILPRLPKGIAAADGEGELSLAQAATNTPPHTPTALPSQRPSSTMFPTRTPTTLPSPMVLPTRTLTFTPTALPTRTLTHTPRRTNTLTPVPTLTNPFTGLAFVDWRAIDGAVQLDRPVRWQVENLQRAGPTAYIFFQTGAPDTFFQIAVLPIALFENPVLTANPTNEALLAAFVENYDPSLLQNAELAGVKALYYPRRVTRESNQTRQQISLTIDTYVALLDSQIFVFLQGLTPTEFQAEMATVLTRVRETVKIDVANVRQQYASLLATPTPRPTNTAAFTATPDVSAFVMRTLTARAIPPTTTPPIQATVGAIIAATDRAIFIGTAVAATFAAQTRTALVSTPNIPATIEAAVSGTQTAIAGGTQPPPPPTVGGLAVTATAITLATPTPLTIRTVPSPDPERPARGLLNATITLIEYSDFQCPFCGRHHQEVYPALFARYGDKIRFEYRHFPLDSIHPNARRAALASECAAEQGMFWDYHDKLYVNQERLSRASLILFAGEVGVRDQTRFIRCLDSAQYANIINKDVEDGQFYGITGTPTFFLVWEGGSEVIIGAQPLNAFTAAIDRALGK
ncbi:MAG TPA: DsbA family protein [Aggregatilineales bacterium]|nr:thioredoxin domain-containing protein [Anaerolineales bacterium]HRE48084.1 DsbA family protein [Aggregatilineales bacterium]